VASGEVRSVCDECGRVASWNADTLLTWAPGRRDIGQVSASGGSPTPASTPASRLDEVHHQHPAFLPDGRHFLFYGAGLDQSSGIYVGSLDEPAEQQESRRLMALKGPTTLGYAGRSGEAVGRILYMVEDKLFALPFDHERLMPTGEPVLVADGVARGGAGVGYFAVSSAGALAYRRGNDDRTLTWFDRGGAIIGSAGPVQADISLSPDGLWAAVASRRANGLELLDLRRGLRTRLTDRPGRSGVWSHDGARVAFSIDEDSTIWVRLSNGARPEEALLTGTPRTTPSDWSPDGRVLLYSSEAEGTRYDIWALPLDGDRTPRIVVRTRFDELRGQFSPDGRWIAYESSEPGGSRIYVAPFSRDAAEAAQRWTVASGIEPRWSPDGKQIFYRNSDDRSVMAVDVSPGPSFTVGTSKRLFPVDGPGPGNRSNAYFDVTPDGQRFLVNTFAPENLTAPITVTLNWRPPGTR
jgi:Tol biopolymer transport system component